eukprot:TRINITY_DN961_c0_g1_i2.p1 TRINITY_DN961_c0_g1~~TRINITY_DN961_c0_g1_i2.p1  ORF type:complete len:270 (-),score=60.73 TRINITY_DN961_c0_g1_i2:24-833(-)
MNFIVKSNQCIKKKYDAEISVPKNVCLSVIQVTSQMLLVQHPFWGMGWISVDCVDPVSFQVSGLSSSVMNQCVDLFDLYQQGVKRKRCYDVVKRDDLVGEIERFDSSLLRHVETTERKGCRGNVSEELMRSIRSFNMDSLNPVHTNVQSYNVVSYSPLLLEIEGFKKDSLKPVTSPVSDNYFVEKDCGMTMRQALNAEIRNFNTVIRPVEYPSTRSVMSEIREFNKNSLRKVETKVSHHVETKVSEEKEARIREITSMINILMKQLEHL